MSRTNIDIDDDLIAECMRKYDLPTKRSAVEFALRRLLMSASQDQLWASVRGIGWDGDLEEMRAGDRVIEW